MSRPLILRIDITLDGFVCGPNGEMDWGSKNLGGDIEPAILSVLSTASAHLMGAATYRGLSAYWPTAREAYAEPMNRIEKVVFSRTMPDDEATWKPARIVRGDLQTEIEALKQGSGGPLLTHGGVHFCRSLIRLGLPDEYLLYRRPVAIGKGQGIFDELPGDLELTLIEARGYDQGIVAERYRSSARR